MRKTSVILALALGLSAFNTFAQNEPAPAQRRDGPPPRQSDSNFDGEPRLEREIQKGRKEKGLEHRDDREGRGLERSRRLEGGQDRLERMDRPELKHRDAGALPERAGRELAPRHEGRRSEFAPKQGRPGRLVPEWNFCPFCGHGLKPAMGQGKTASDIRHEGPGPGNFAAPERRESLGTPRDEFRPMPRGPQDKGDRHGQDAPGNRAPAPVHRPAAPAEDAGR